MKGPATKQKRATNSQSDRMRGLYVRGKKFWYTRMIDGARTQMSLDTEDYGEAVKKVLEIRQSPTLAPVDTFNFSPVGILLVPLLVGLLATVVIVLRQVPRTKRDDSPQVLRSISKRKLP